MACMAFPIDELNFMAAGELKQILDAISRVKDRLDVQVENMGKQLASLTDDMKEKASRPEIVAMEQRFKDDLSRVESGVREDVIGFQNMYESVIAEMKDLRENLNHKLDGLIEARRSQGDSIRHIDERLKKIEPLLPESDRAKGFVFGAEWVIKIVWAVIGSAATIALLKFLGVKP